MRSLFIGHFILIRTASSSDQQLVKICFEFIVLYFYEYLLMRSNYLSLFQNCILRCKGCIIFKIWCLWHAPGHISLSIEYLAEMNSMIQEMSIKLPWWVLLRYSMIIKVLEMFWTCFRSVQYALVLQVDWDWDLKCIGINFRIEVVLTRCIVSIQVNKIMKS